MSESFEEECVFEWTIRNISYCWFETGEALESPTFYALGSETLWSIVVYPRGNVDDDQVSVHLQREDAPFGREIVEASFKFAFLDKNDSLLIVGPVTKQDFAEGSVSGRIKLVRHDRLFGTERENFIPDGILKVQCTLWIKNSVPIAETLYLCAETIFKIHRKDFFWRIEGFSTANAQFKDFRIMNGDKNVMTFSIRLRSSGEIYLAIKTWNEIIKSISIDISLIDSEKRRVSFGSHKIFTAHDCEKEIYLSREKWMENKSRYLPNDVLSLVCEFAYSSGTILSTNALLDNFRPIYPDDSKEAIENLETLLVPSQNEPQQAETLAADLKSM